MALGRSTRFRFDTGTVRLLRRADLGPTGFGPVQRPLVPFPTDRPSYSRRWSVASSP